MQKNLTKHGNSYALIIDKAILDLLKITPETPLELSTDGTTLTITPQASKPARKTRASIQRVGERHAKAFKRLAE